MNKKISDKNNANETFEEIKNEVEKWKVELNNFNEKYKKQINDKLNSLNEIEIRLKQKVRNSREINLKGIRERRREYEFQIRDLKNQMIDEFEKISIINKNNQEVLKRFTINFQNTKKDIRDARQDFAKEAERVHNIKFKIDEKFDNVLNTLVLFSFLIVISVTILLAILNISQPLKFLDIKNNGVLYIITLAVIVITTICFVWFAKKAFEKLIKELKNYWQGKK